MHLSDSQECRRAEVEAPTVSSAAAEANMSCRDMSCRDAVLRTVGILGDVAPQYRVFRVTECAPSVKLWFYPVSEVTECADSVKRSTTGCLYFPSVGTR